MVTGGAPPTLDLDQFDYLHEFDIHKNTGDGGPPTINVPLENTAFGVLGMVVFRARRRTC